MGTEARLGSVVLRGDPLPTSSGWRGWGSPGALTPPTWGEDPPHRASPSRLLQNRWVGAGGASVGALPGAGGRAGGTPGCFLPWRPQRPRACGLAEPGSWRGFGWDWSATPPRWAGGCRGAGALWGPGVGQGPGSAETGSPLGTRRRFLRGSAGRPAGARVLIGGRAVRIPSAGRSHAGSVAKVTKPLFYSSERRRPGVLCAPWERGCGFSPSGCLAMRAQPPVPG